MKKKKKKSKKKKEKKKGRKEGNSPADPGRRALVTCGRGSILTDSHAGSKSERKKVRA